MSTPRATQMRDEILGRYQPARTPRHLPRLGEELLEIAISAITGLTLPGMMLDPGWTLPASILLIHNAARSRDTGRRSQSWSEQLRVASFDEWQSGSERDLNN